MKFSATSNMNGGLLLKAGKIWQKKRSLEKSVVEFSSLINKNKGKVVVKLT